MFWNKSGAKGIKSTIFWRKAILKRFAEAGATIAVQASEDVVPESQLQEASSAGACCLGRASTS